MPVVVEDDAMLLGSIDGALIDPDTGTIEGLFVRVPRFPSGGMLFLSSMDILRWGTRVHVRNSDVLVAPEEIIRLQPLLQDSRTFLGQRMQMQSGRVIGRCRDVQFETETLRIEWVFPKTFLRWGVALPVADILEVTPAAIIVKETIMPETEKSEEPKKVELPDVLPDMQEPATMTKTPPG